VENPPKAVNKYVSGKIARLLESNNESFVRASLARLRRGIGKNPGSLPDIWELTLEGMPEELISRTYKTEPTYAEWAAHMALTLFALHQQGKNPQESPMSQSDKPLGGAVRAYTLINDASADAVKRRFDAAITSNSVDELAVHLRGLIQLLRSASIPLDYPQLAEDLYRFQSTESRDSVRLSWGRSYYYISRKDEE